MGRSRVGSECKANRATSTRAGLYAEVCNLVISGGPVRHLLGMFLARLMGNPSLRPHAASWMQRRPHAAAR